MSWLAGIIPQLLSWLFSGSVKTSATSTEGQLAKLGLDSATLKGEEPPKL